MVIIIHIPVIIKVTKHEVLCPTMIHRSWSWSTFLLTLLLVHLKSAEECYHVFVLPQHGLDLDVQDELGMTALQWAISNSHIPVVEVLLSAGCDTECIDNTGDNPLLLATRKDDVIIQDILLSHGCNVTITDRWGGCHDSRDIADSLFNILGVLRNVLGALHNVLGVIRNAIGSVINVMQVQLLWVRKGLPYQW